jgi:hypothetical protein
MKQATALAADIGASPGAFALHAIEAAAKGLAVVPVVGKKTQVKAYHMWRNPPSTGPIYKWASDFPAADLGIVTGPLSGVTVVDLDKRDQLEAAEKHFGKTPLVSQTTNGWHLFYRHNGEGCPRLSDPFIGDLKGKNGIIVIPPSPGKTFYRGSWADLPNLTVMLTPVAQASPAYMAQRGERNNSVFRQGQLLASSCDSLGDLVDELLSFNDDVCIPPLPEAEVIRAAESAWKQETEDRNWVGHPRSCGQVVVSDNDVDRFANASIKNGPDAVFLRVKLRAKHAARDSRGQPFAIATQAMADAGVIPGWKEKRYRNAKNVLLEMGEIVRLRKGRTLKDKNGAIVGREPDMFRFGGGKPRSVVFDGNVIEHPAPLSLRPITEKGRR